MRHSKPAPKPGDEKILNRRAYVYAPDHPNVSPGSWFGGWILRSRFIASEMIGRPLHPGEVVHHVDGDVKNDDPANLAVMTIAEHTRTHNCGQLVPLKFARRFVSP